MKPIYNASVLIAEDEFIEAQDIKRICLDIGFRVVGIAQNKNDAISLYQLYRPDIVIIDIKLGADAKAGIKIAEHVYNIASLPLFLFLTQFSSLKMIKEATQFLPINYLVKPFTEVQLKATLLSAMEKYITWMPGSTASILHLGKIFIPESKSGYALRALDLNDIVHLEADGSYCFVHTNKKPIHISVNLKQFSSLLPDNIFIRAHRSFVVNLRHVNGLDRNKRIVYIGESHVEIPIGSKYYTSLINRLTKMN
ncbi:MAG: response regulator [Bacteroidetes bacterium]|nr:response regulator [Bacteroidota bacterium]